MKIIDAIKSTVHSNKENHDHGHEHEHECDACATAASNSHEIVDTRIDKLLLIRIVIAIALFVLGLVSGVDETGVLIFMIAAAVIVGYDVIFDAISGIFSGNGLTEQALMAIAAVAAFIIGEYHEAGALLILFQIGELLQRYAVGKTKNTVSSLAQLRPDTACLLVEGTERVVAASEVKFDDLIIVRPGERIPADSVLVEGATTLDMSALTGESLPCDALPGMELLSGAVNLTSVITAKVLRPEAQSTAARILDMVRSEDSAKAKPEKFITKFAKIYTPIVLIAALIIAVLLPLVSEIAFSDSLYRALVLLVISCPCALVISVPLSYFAGMGGASKRGVLFKSSMAIDGVASSQAVVFDKTGTLSNGSFELSAITPVDGLDEARLLETAAHAEYFSNHPLARAIVKAYGREIRTELISDFTDKPGKGIETTIGGSVVTAGNRALMEEKQVAIPESGTADVCIYIAVDNRYMGCISLRDEVKTTSAEAVDDLRYNLGQDIIMLTGDRREIAKQVSSEIGIDEFYGECLPEDKVRRVKDLKTRYQKNESLVFVGDGLNDAPVLTSATVGISMGGIGSDAAVEASDVVILDDDPRKVAFAIRSARKTRSVVYQNIAFSLLIKLIVLVLGVVGISTLWFAVIADVGVCLLVILSSMRAFVVK